MYVDPNSGGIVFQILMVIFGLFSGIIVLFSSKIRMGFSRFIRRFREKSTDRNDGTASRVGLKAKDE